MIDVRLGGLGKCISKTSKKWAFFRNFRDISTKATPEITIYCILLTNFEKMLKHFAQKTLFPSFALPLVNGPALGRVTPSPNNTNLYRIFRLNNSYMNFTSYNFEIFVSFSLNIYQMVPLSLSNPF